MPDEKKPNCPIIPPYNQETRGLNGQVTAVNRIPMPCLGKPGTEDATGGGCAMWKACQELPTLLMPSRMSS